MISSFNFKNFNAERKRFPVGLMTRFVGGSIPPSVHYSVYKMPQLDKEIFIEYFFWIFLILLNFHSEFMVTENFLRINTRYFVYYQLKKAKNFFEAEKHLLNKYIFDKVSVFIRSKK